jgi:hypothetical protein
MYYYIVYETYHYELYYSFCPFTLAYAIEQLIPRDESITIGALSVSQAFSFVSGHRANRTCMIMSELKHRY